MLTRQTLKTCFGSVRLDCRNQIGIAIDDKLTGQKEISLMILFVPEGVILYSGKAERQKEGLKNVCAYEY